MLFLLVLSACWVVASTELSCPQHCFCFVDPDGFKAANCSSLTLSSTAPSPIEVLALQPHMRGVQTALFPRAFKAFPKVKFLFAINCSIVHIPNDVFQGLDFVIEIDLSFNKIQHLNGVVFKDLGSLHTLLLRGNPLHLSYWDAIVSNSLRKLDMGRCGLKKIPAGTFVNAGSLTHLILDGNELHTLVHNEVPTGLRYLNLAHNRITNVPIEVLKSMSYLRKLDLSRNPINCTCNLLILQDWFSGQGVTFENEVFCSHPSQYTGQKLNKINENELCSLEDTKRQRHINDIKHYSDLKFHRKHNMILDQGFQGDQPYNSDAEVMFVNDDLHGITHMEMKGWHRNPADDVSVESNKLGNSKNELHSTGQELIDPSHVLPSDDLNKLEVKHEDLELTTYSENKNKKEVNITEEQIKENFDVVSDMDDGSGSNPFDDIEHLTHLFANQSGESMTTILPEVSGNISSFYFPSTSSDVADYNYDTQHDYSGEVVTTTEAMKEFEVEEGSGEIENKTLEREPITTVGWMEEQENETSSEFPIIVDNEIDLIFNHTSNSTIAQYISNKTVEVNISSEIESTSENSVNETISSIVSSVEVEETSPDYGITVANETNTDIDLQIEEGSGTDVVSSSISSLETVSTSHNFSSATESFSSSVASSASSVLAETTTEGNQMPIMEISSLPEIISPSSSSLGSTEVPTTSESIVPFEDVEIIREKNREAQGRIRELPAEEETGKEVGHTMLSYIVLGLLIALIIVVITIIVCRKVSGNKKKVRLPTDNENNIGTEMQDMLLPKAGENGIKVVPQNGTSNGKEIKEEEVPVLSKDWDDKTEPIETVTARLSMLAKPQTPVFIHKTLT